MNLLSIGMVQDFTGLPMMYIGNYKETSKEIVCFYKGIRLSPAKMRRLTQATGDARSDGD